ncbi:hypothetical protein ELI37_21350 [Rhizobium leguminosarum]|nr:hypothetical protein ELI37_21350 [Rhizobium leguminosarum]
MPGQGGGQCHPPGFRRAQHPNVSTSRQERRRHHLERFSFSWKRRTALTFCFYAIPDGKPLRTFPELALGPGIYGR